MSRPQSQLSWCPYKARPYFFRPLLSLAPRLGLQPADDAINLITGQANYVCTPSHVLLLSWLRPHGQPI